MKVNKTTAWFEDWFNSPYYHILYKHRNTTEAKQFIDNLIEKLHIQQGSRILDLACGRGRHSVYLAQLGFDVTGADLSQKNIDFARQFEHETLSFKVHDMRHTLEHEGFDYLLNMFTSFGYFDDEEDNHATFKAIAQNLKPGGVAVIDFLNAEKTKRKLIENEEKEVSDILFQITREYVDGAIIKHINFNDGGTPYHYREKVQALSLNDFEKYSSFAGLELVNVYGGYTLQPFDPYDADRMIVVLKK